MKKTAIAQRVRELELETKELRAQLLASSFFAHESIHRVSNDRMKGSGVILELSFLGGKTVFEPVYIENGLSSATIAAIKADLKATNIHKCDFSFKKTT